MMHSKDLDPLRDALLSLDRGSARSPECLGADEIAAFVDGAVAEDERPRLLRHLATCRHCRTTVAAVARTLADPAVASEVARVERGAGSRRFRVAAPIAAAAAVLLLMLSPFLDPARPVPTPTHRAPTILGSGIPTPRAPLGVVSRATSFAWAPVAGADRYRVSLFDASGVVVFESEVSDTVVSLPDSVRPRVGDRYLWRVAARTDLDRWAASALAEFRLVAAP